MQNLSRREILGSATAVAGASLLGSCGRPAHAHSPLPSGTGCPSGSGYKYVPLDPRAVVAYVGEMFPAGGCMYSLFGGVMRALADVAGEPFASFPLEMMRYGEGGIGGWGTICGALNGGAALIGLFHPEEDKQRKAALIGELFSWYQSTRLPRFVPEGAEATTRTVSDSVLCHLSVGAWVKASGHAAFTPEKKERCRRLTIDVAKKTVEILNADARDGAGASMLHPLTASCLSCHGKTHTPGDAMGKMECGPCHELPEEHLTPR